MHAIIICVCSCCGAHIIQQEQVDVSLWRNQDQNSSQGTHEIEVLVTVKATALDMLKDSVDTNKVKEADLLSRADRRSPAKLDGATLMTLCKFYCGFLNEDVPHLVEELVDFHATEGTHGHHRLLVGHPEGGGLAQEAPSPAWPS